MYIVCQYLQESEKFLKMQSQREKRIDELEIAVGRMKQHQELLQSRLREEGERKSKLEVISPAVRMEQL